MAHPFSFTDTQFNRLFPFYMLIDRELKVVAYGNSIGKLCDWQKIQQFNHSFTIPRPLTPINSVTDLIALQNQLVVLEPSGEENFKLRGQFEYLPDTEEVLFVGSPWFDSMEQVREKKLVIDDFAHHDPLIDLLHVMKSVEITNDDLKQLVNTINTQKNELKKANKEIHDIALFPMQNPDPLIRINNEGTILKMNPSAEKLTSFEFEGNELNQATFFKLIINRIDRSQDRWILEAKSGEKDYSFVCKSLLDDGYINIYGRDITNQKKNEEELKRLSLVASANENGVLLTRPDGKITWANEAFCKLTGFSLDDTIGKTPIELGRGPLTDANALEKVVDNFLKGMAFNIEIIYYRKDGTWFWSRPTVQPIKNSQGEITEYFGIIEDISSEKAVQRTLKEYEERLKMALTNIGDNFWEHNFKTGKTYFSNPDNNLLGYQIGEFSDEAELWWNSIHPDDKVLLQENDRKYKAGLLDQHSFEYRMIHKDGAIHWVLDRGVVTEKDENSKPLKIIGTHIDITKQKELELELTKSKEAAEASTRAKEQFLANMSHEIRTPLNAITGMANQLSKTTLNSDQQFYLNTIQSAAENLLIIINDILDLSKIEAGKLTLENIGFEPKFVVGRALQAMLHKAEEKGLALTNTYCDNRLSPVLLGDPYRLNQVLLNLISNAIKFTEKGNVDIRCEVVNESSSKQSVKVSVEDTGIGMDESFVKHLFQKFSQEDVSVTRKFGGTGLGMSICKDLIDLMDGNIQVQSEKGVGTLVSFTVTLKKGTVEQLPVKESGFINTSILDGKKILVTDDNEMNRLVASMILKNYGATIEEAENGLEAVKKSQNQLFDIILMDVQMPVMDGVRATWEIRNTINARIPVIALTALAIKGDEERFIKAGMNDYLSKPFEENQLLAVVTRWLGKGEMAGQSVQKNVKSEQLFDLTKLKNIARGNEAFVNKMIALFVVQAPASVKEIKEAYEENDFEKVKELAHRMKPSIDNMGIISLKNEIREIEKNAALNQSSEQIEKLILKLEEVVTEVTNKLKMR